MASRDRANMKPKADLRHATMQNLNSSMMLRLSTFFRLSILPSRANFRFDFPQLPGAHTLQSLFHLLDVIDLDKSL
ncbi:hypothetical protein BGY98DRAFT_966405 [Russula aff. rugulosa BPL654]|nr:hypothetical protein BGY98DRAFT_966405 [Russula aff. rugulosa BPL654]